MLRHLTIRDFVIVDRLELEFLEGFGALTGETGAGKSILIDALALALGERADAGVVRSGCDKAEVAATFDVANLSEVRAWLSGNDLDGDDELILRRVVDAGGRSRAYINGSPATAQQLREVGEWLLIFMASTPISRYCAPMLSATCSIPMPDLAGWRVT